MTLGLSLLVLGAIPFIRFLFFAAMGEGDGHMQSLVFGSALLVAAFISFALLVIADLQKTNRILLEDQLQRQKEQQYKQ